MVIDAMLTARAALWGEFTKLPQGRPRRRRLPATDECALVALTYRSAVDDPARFEKSNTVGAFGLTPKKYQSGETNRDGGVSKVGDAMVRTALFGSAHIMLTRATRFFSLKRWALDVARRRGMTREGYPCTQTQRRTSSHVGGCVGLPQEREPLWRHEERLCD